MNKKADMTKSKRRLAILWFFGAGIVFMLLLAQSVTGKHGDKITEVWGWAMQTLMPTLSLMLSVFVIDAMKKSTRARKVDRFFFRLTFWLSFIYLFLVLSTILFQPFVDISTIDWMKQSNMWLGSFQGLVSISLGIFFFKDEDK